MARILDLDRTMKCHFRSASQRGVLDLVARGKSNQEIADALGISLDGAKWHMREILSKLGVDTREEAAEYWRRYNGWPSRLRRLARGLGSLTLGRWVAGASGVVFVAAASLAVASYLRGDPDLPATSAQTTAGSDATAGSEPPQTLDAGGITEARIVQGGPCCSEWANSRVVAADPAGLATLQRLVGLVNAATVVGPEPPGGLPDIFAVVAEGPQGFTVAPAYRCETATTPDYESFSCDQVPGNAILWRDSQGWELHSWGLYEWLRSGYQQDFPRTGMTP